MYTHCAASETHENAGISSYMLINSMVFLTQLGASPIRLALTVRERRRRLRPTSLTTHATTHCKDAHDGKSRTSYNHTGNAITTVFHTDSMRRYRQSGERLRCITACRMPRTWKPFTWIVLQQIHIWVLRFLAQRCHHQYTSTSCVWC